MGAETLEGHGTHFRVFAPKRDRVTLVLEGSRTVELEREDAAFFGRLVDDVGAGARYQLRFDDKNDLFPDPASRFQPEGPHGPSEVVDPSAFRWSDGAWPGVRIEGQVVYELHIGTFTAEGTFAAATRELEELRDAGITLIEVMPVSEFPGKFGWGYDGVDLYAPTRLYGRPDDLRAFVDRAHALGVGVILDVVYNHFGPDGNFLREHCDDFFTDRFENDWGDSLDFESDANVRNFYIENAGYWIEEFHLDGLRLDATQNISDDSKLHVIAEIVKRAREKAGSRTIVVFAENEPQDAKIARPVERGGYGVDAMWNDDFHHSACVAAKGHAEAYYSSTKGGAQELLSAIKWGFLFQGQLYPWQKSRRGHSALDLPGAAFTLFLENHDQVSNSATGARLHQLTSPGVFRALTALFLLAPGTPLLFQGQEYGSTKPFHYFADHEPKLAQMVAEGRLGFLKQFPSIASEEAQRCVPRPDDPDTFARCKLDFSERAKNHAIYDLHKDLLALRKQQPFARQDKRALDGAVLGPRAILLRYGFGSAKDRLLLVNYGEDLEVGGLAEPLLAPPEDCTWKILLATESPRYGGSGAPPLGPHGELMLAAGSAIVFEPTAKES